MSVANISHTNFSSVIFLLFNFTLSKKKAEELILIHYYKQKFIFQKIFLGFTQHYILL